MLPNVIVVFTKRHNKSVKDHLAKNPGLAELLFIVVLLMKLLFRTLWDTPVPLLQNAEQRFQHFHCSNRQPQSLSIKTWGK